MQLAPGIIHHREISRSPGQPYRQDQCEDRQPGHRAAVLVIGPDAGVSVIRAREPYRIRDIGAAWRGGHSRRSSSDRRTTVEMFSVSDTVSATVER